MQRSTLFAACVLPFVNADGNTSYPIMASEEEIDEMRRNIQIVQEDHHRRGASLHSTCSNDMRSTMPGCHQSGEMWCWATAVAAATEHYTGRSGDQCRGLECQVVGHAYKEDCCPFKSATDHCGEHGGYAYQIVDELKHSTGMSFTEAKGTVSKTALDASLQSGSPVILLVGNDKQATHVVTLHGCNGSGKYWHHDPERDYGTFEAVDYNWLAGDMCFAWVGRRLEVCKGSKNPGEDFRFYRKWWNTVYIPSHSETVV